MLEVRTVNHHYGRVQALFDLDFTVENGEILGFLGPNGAGKSTTMRIVTGYLSPTSGQVLFDGTDIRHPKSTLRRHLGYLPEHVPLYPELTVREYLYWAARVKRAAAPARQVDEVMERCGLAPRAGKLVRTLSKGFRQRVGLAQAILGETRLLILDEPTVGLDPAQIRDIRALIRELGREKTIILSTHILPEVELTCDRVLIIDEGRIVAEGDPRELACDAAGRGRFSLQLGTGDAEAVCAAYAKLPGVLAARSEGEGAFLIETEPEEDLRAAITGLAQEKGWPILEFTRAAASLEDAFVRLVCEEKSPGTEPADLPAQTMAEAEAETETRDGGASS